ncbi:MAG TPA: enoyl-CoA hydratase/isomerase family protein [Caldithrix sp.]|nr:enoyl-CoA hydratase/isomerase family protein [Caldithrix sp.]
MQINSFIRDEIGIIELDNPPYNQLTSPIFINQDKLDTFLSNDVLKGIVIKGSGRNFCAGADRESIAQQIQNPDDFENLLNQGKQIIKSVQMCPVPVVAAVQGSCLGAGLEIALACHFIFASKNAMFGFPESGIQLMPGFGGSVFGTGRLSRKNMIKLILSAELINGEGALKIGLVDRIFTGSQVIDESINYLKSLTANKPVHLIRTIMQSIHNSEILSRDEALKIETENFIKLARRLDTLKISQ